MGADAMARDTASGVREPAVASLRPLTPTTPTRIDPVPILDRAAEKRDHHAVRPTSRVFALLLVALLAVLPPIVCADPPDPTWMGGYWDDDDFDNVVNAIATTVALKGPDRVAVELPTLVYIAPVATSQEHGWRAPLLAAASPRAPPVVSPTHS